MSEKPIKIGEVYVIGFTLCVPYTFKHGQETTTGQLNFPVNITEEEILRSVRMAYQDWKQARPQELLSLRGRELDE